MRATNFLAILRHALRKEEPARYEHSAAEHRREEREQTTLNLLRGEIGEYSPNNQAERRYREKTLFWTRVTCLVSVITMGAVIYYAVVAKHQRDAMRDQVTQMREANGLTKEAQEDTRKLIAAESRAWLTFDAARLVTMSGDRAVAELTIRSTGKNSAVQATSRLALEATEVPKSLDDLKASETKYLGTIIPGSKRDVVVSLDKIAQEQWDAVNAKRTHLVMSGFIVYTDRFGSRGWTPICQYWSINRGGFVDCGISDMAPE